MVAISIIVLFVWLSKLIVIKASNDVFNQCIRSTPNPGIIKCIGSYTLSSLHSIDKMDNYTLTNGLEMIRTDSDRQRSFAEFIVNDPTDFRGLLENAGTLIGQRSLQWDLAVIEPGLMLRVGPTADSNSMLEFVMDPTKDRGDRYLVEEPSTARILTRQFILPFLLGIKFNLFTILPLIFAGIMLLLKKAMFLGKFAMFITGLLGFGNLLSLGGQFGGFGGLGGIGVQPNRPFGGGFGGGGLGSFGNHHHQGGFNDGLGGGYYKHSGGNPVTFNEFSLSEKDPQYADQFYNYEKKLLQTKSDKLFEKDPKTATSEQPGRANSQRSFVWQAS